VEAVSDAVRMELAPFGIQVVVVEPGVTNTSMYDNAATKLARYDGSLDAYRPFWPKGFAFPRRLLERATAVDRVAAAIAEAALTPTPRERYRPGVRGRINEWLLTSLPTRRADRIRTRIAGLAGTARLQRGAGASR
jgi:NAD(P)-dependent dehydrogenase (short-subunit alcohol dehydrogenase family)